MCRKARIALTTGTTITAKMRNAITPGGGVLEDPVDAERSHGLSTLKYTGFPANEPASTRSSTSAASGSEPTHARLASQ